MVYYVGIFNVFYCRFESEGGHVFFSNVIGFTGSSFIIKETMLLIRLPFLPFHSLTSYLRGRSIGLGQGLNWPRPGWTYPSRPPPYARSTDKEGLPAVDKGVGERGGRASSASGGVRVQVQTSSSPDELKSRRGFGSGPSGGVSRVK